MAGLTDAAGNPLAADKIWSFATSGNAANPPDTTIRSGPADPATSAEARFTLAASEPNVTFECALDGAPFEPCPMESGPAAKAGQSSNLGAERSDAARADGAPRMTAKDHAKGHKRAPHHQSSKRPKRVASEQPGGSGGCQNKSNRCNTLIVVTDLADGPHSLAVRAKDDAGNVDPTPATYSWTVDMTAATTSAAPTNAGSRTVSDKSSGSAITDREPEDKSTGVATTATIEVTFAEAIDPTSLTTATFTLQQPDGQPVAATVTYDAASQTATLDPKTSLAPKTPYVAMLKGGAGGIATASGPVFPSDITWSFTTVSQVKHAKSRKSSQARIATTATTSTFTFAPDRPMPAWKAPTLTTNFGSSNNLIVDTSPQTESDLRFAVSGVGSGAVGQALLRVHTTSYSGAGTNIGPAVYPLAQTVGTNPASPGTPNLAERRRDCQCWGDRRQYVGRV